MAKKAKDGFWTNELKLWGVAVKKVGADFACTAHQVSTEMLSGKSPKKKKPKNNRYGNHRQSNRRYR